MMTLKTYLACLIILVVVISCYSHSKVTNISSKPEDSLVPPPAPPKLSGRKYKEYLKNYDCVYNGKLSVDERLKIYPFSKAMRVLLVSFPAVKLWHGTEGYTFGGGIPKKDDQVDTAAFKEKIELNKLQINVLSDILYNYNYRKDKDLLISHLSCLLPTENAVIFLDEQKKCFAYLELCFCDCMDYEIVPNSMRMGDFCRGKMELLKNYFAEQGISYGLNNECGHSN